MINNKNQVAVPPNAMTYDIYKSKWLREKEEEMKRRFEAEEATKGEAPSAP